MASAAQPAPEKSTARVERTLQRILQEIPGTKAFGARKQKEIDESVKRYHDRLDKVLSKDKFDGGTLDEILWKRLAPLDFWLERAAEWAVAVILCIGIGCAVLTPMVIAHLTRLHLDSREQWLAFWVLSMAAAFAIGLVSVIPAVLLIDLETDFFGKTFPAITVSSMSVMLFVVGWIGYKWIGYKWWPASGAQIGLLQLSVLSGILTIFAAIIPLVCAAFIMTTFIASLRTRRTLLYPQACVVDQIAKALDVVKTSGVYWSSQQNRLDMSGSLESAARCVEQFLPAALKTGDATADAWMKSELEKRAAGIREIELDTLIADAHAPQNVPARIEAALLNAIRFEWGELPAAEPQKQTPREKLSTRLLAAGHALILAVLPLGLLILIGRPGSPLQLTGETLNWARLGLALWLVVSLLPIIDKNYAATSNAANILKQLPGFGGKKDESAESR